MALVMRLNAAITPGISSSLLRTRAFFFSWATVEKSNSKLKNP
jgi:hypothetical protein